MTALEVFQKTHGEEYRKLIQSKALQSGLLLLNLRKIEFITGLSDEDIEKHSREILGGLRDHFKHESDLLNLHHEKEFKLTPDQPEEYITHEAEAARQERIDTIRKEKAKKGKK